AVSARGTPGARSVCAGAVVLGNPDACFLERCCPGQPCTFSGMPNGAPCDGANPCRVCRSAACTIASESTLDTQRVRLTHGATEARVFASGRLMPLGALDPVVDGVSLSLLDRSGAVLLAAFAASGSAVPNQGGVSRAAAA